MNPGAKETVATLVLGYAAPQRPEFQERMFALLAWFVAAIPLLYHATYFPHLVIAWPRSLMFFWNAPDIWNQAATIFTFSIVPLGLVLSVASLACLVRREVGLFYLLVASLFLTSVALQISLLPLYYRLHLSIGSQLSFLFPLARGITPLALPLLLLFVLNPRSSQSPHSRSLFLHLLLLVISALGAGEMIYSFYDNPQSWHGPIMDFWTFLDANPTGTLICLGQLSLDVAIVLLFVQLAQYAVTRRANATFLRASTSLLLVGWLFLLIAGTLAQVYPPFFALRSRYGDNSYAEYGFLALPLDNEWDTLPFRIAYGMQFLASAGIALLFILSFRIALNRPELPWNRPREEMANDEIRMTKQ